MHTISLASPLGFKSIFGIGFTTKLKVLVAGQLVFIGFTIVAITFCVAVLNGLGKWGRTIPFANVNEIVIPVCDPKSVLSMVLVSKGKKPFCVAGLFISSSHLINCDAATGKICGNLSTIKVIVSSSKHGPFVACVTLLVTLTVIVCVVFTVKVGIGLITAPVVS